MKLKWYVFFITTLILLAFKLLLCNKFEIMGSIPDLLFILSIYIALRGKLYQAALAGFFLGFMRDVTTCEQFGFFSFLFCSTNVLFFKLRQEMFIEHPLVPIGTIFLACFLTNFFHICLISLLYKASLNFELVIKLLIISSYTAFLAPFLIISIKEILWKPCKR